MEKYNVFYLYFDDVFNQYATKKLKLIGKVKKFHNYNENLLEILFSFSNSYLNINDIDCYSQCDSLSEIRIAAKTQKKLKEIEYQFRFYFNGIWG